MLPVTVLAADYDKPNVLYVGNTKITSDSFWTSSDGGKTWTQLKTAPLDNYIHYDGDGTLTLHNVSIQGEYNDKISGHGIDARSNSGSVSLSIVLNGENNVSGMYGINVINEVGNASLNIRGQGSLTVSGHSGNGIGIFVSANGCDTNLTIEEANVTASGNQEGGSGVQLTTSQSGSPNLTIAVKGGSLQASGETNGINFFSNADNADAVANLQVSGNAMVKASNIRTMKNGTGSAPELKPAASDSDSTGGIIWDGKEGTVYGNVTLQEDLEIGEGESLTIGKDASFTVPSDKTLTNNGKIINYGTINGTVTGTVAIPLTEEMITVANATYTGVAVNPDVKVEKEDVIYTEGRDYTVFSDNINAGTAKVTVTPIKGSLLLGDAVEKEFTITQADNEWTTALSMDGWTYGEDAKEPTAVAKFGTPIFTYSNEENGTYTTKQPVNAGTWYVKATVEGTDNYTGLSGIKEFTIAKAEAPENGKIGPAEGTDKEIHIYSDQSTFSLSVVADMKSVGKWVWKVTEGTDVADITNVEAQQLKAAGNESEGNKSKATFKVLGTGTVKITATYMNNNYKDYKVEFSVSVSTPPVVVTYHDLHITESTGAKLVSRYGKTSTPDGGSFTLSLEKEEGYEDCEPTVYYKRGRFGEWKELKLDEVSGYYQIRSVYTDIYVKVSGDGIWPVSNEEVEAQEVKVYTRNGAIIVSTPSLMDVQIISMTGSVVAADKVAGQREFRNLAEGIYVVRVGEEIVKVRL